MFISSNISYILPKNKAPVIIRGFMQYSLSSSSYANFKSSFPIVLFLIPARCVFQQISRLTAQLPANRIEGGKAYGFYLPCFQIGKVSQGNAYFIRQFIERYFPVCHHTVQSHYNRHVHPSYTVSSYSCCR
jgi:hypothetical protein